MMKMAHTSRNVLAVITIFSVVLVTSAFADRPLHIQPDGSDFVIANGQHRFNRPLYGTHSAFYVYAGDKPEFMMSLPGKGGTLWLGMMT